MIPPHDAKSAGSRQPAELCSAAVWEMISLAPSQAPDVCMTALCSPDGLIGTGTVPGVAALSAARGSKFLRPCQPSNAAMLGLISFLAQSCARSSTRTISGFFAECFHEQPTWIQ